MSSDSAWDLAIKIIVLQDPGKSKTCWYLADEFNCIQLGTDRRNQQIMGPKQHIFGKTLAFIWLQLKLAACNTRMQINIQRQLLRAGS